MGLALAVSPMLTVVLLTQQQRLFLGGAVFCVVLLIFSLRSTFAAPVDRRSLTRLQNYIDREENLSPLEKFIEHEELEAATRNRRRDRSADLLPTVSKFLANSRVDMLNRLSANLNRIGSNWRASEIVYAAVLLALLGFFVVGVVMQKWIPGLIAAAIAFKAPFMVVGIKAKRWMNKFETQLADTLLLMSNATAAGYGFQQAMEMVAREGLPPMGDEFAKVSQEVQLGVPISEGLQHMAQRVDNPDFNLTVTAIQISMEVGGALSEILRSISETIRERVRIRGEISILTAQGKMTGLMLSALPIFMFVLLMFVGNDPQSGERYTDPLTKGKEYPAGPKLIIVGIILQLVGYYFINKIVNIEI